MARFLALKEVVFPPLNHLVDDEMTEMLHWFVFSSGTNMEMIIMLIRIVLTPGEGWESSMPFPEEAHHHFRHYFIVFLEN